MLALEGCLLAIQYLVTIKLFFRYAHKAWKMPNLPDIIVAMCCLVINIMTIVTVFDSNIPEIPDMNIYAYKSTVMILIVSILSLIVSMIIGQGCDTWIGLFFLLKAFVFGMANQEVLNSFLIGFLIIITYHQINLPETTTRLLIPLHVFWMIYMFSAILFAYDQRSKMFLVLIIMNTWLNWPTILFYLDEFSRL